MSRRPTYTMESGASLGGGDSLTSSNHSNPGITLLSGINPSVSIPIGMPCMFPLPDTSGVFRSACASTQIIPVSGLARKTPARLPMATLTRGNRPARSFVSTTSSYLEAVFHASSSSLGLVVCKWFQSRGPGGPRLSIRERRGLWGCPFHSHSHSHSRPRTDTGFGRRTCRNKFLFLVKTHALVAFIVAPRAAYGNTAVFVRGIRRQYGRWEFRQVLISPLRWTLVNVNDSVSCRFDAWTCKCQPLFTK